MYDKTTWVAGGAPGISAVKLNKIESGIEAAHDLIENATYATEDTTTQQVTSLPSTAMKSPFASAELEGNTNTNIVSNGNFTSTAGWSAAGATHAVANNIMSNTGNGSATNGQEYKDTGIKSSAGKKVFVATKVRVTNANCTVLSVPVEASGGSTINLLSQSSPVQNQWYYVYGIATFTTHTGNILVNHRHYYLDAATATGKVMEVKEVLAIDMGADSTNPLYNLTADQMNARFANWFDSTKSVGMQRVKSVGKNLFDKDTVVQGRINTTTGLIEASAGVVTSDFIRLKPSAQYTRTTTTGSTRYAIYDINKTLISASTSVFTFTMPTNGEYYRFSMGDSEKDTAQLELGSTATTYEPYTESTAYTTPELRRVGTVADTVDLLSGRHTKNISDWYSLQSGDITTLITAAPNTDYVRIAKPATYKYYNIITGAFGSALIGNYARKAYADDVANVNTYAEDASLLSFTLVVAKGTYASLAAAQTALAGTQILYQLATPTITNYLPSTLVTEPSGTLYLEPNITDVGYYGTNIAIADTNYPISSLDWINKIDVDTGAFIPVDITLCTVASGGLSFTISTAVAGEYYEYGYSYSTELSVIPSLAYSYSTNLKAQVNETVNAVERLEEKIEETSANAQTHISHTLATAVSDFLVASGAGIFVKKTLAEVKAILGLAFGTIAGSYCQGNDARLSDARVANGGNADTVGSYPPDMLQKNNRISGNVSYTDTVGLTTVTKLIPLGGNYKNGIATITSGEIGIIVFFNTDNLKTKICGSPGHAWSRAEKGWVTISSDASTSWGWKVASTVTGVVRIQEVYISGNDIRIDFISTSGSYALTCRVDWEVW